MGSKIGIMVVVGYRSVVIVWWGDIVPAVAASGRDIIVYCPDGVWVTSDHGPVGHESHMLDEVSSESVLAWAKKG